MQVYGEKAGSLASTLFFTRRRVFRGSASFFLLRVPYRSGAFFLFHFCVLDMYITDAFIGGDTSCFSAQTTQAPPPPKHNMDSLRNFLALWYPGALNRIDSGSVRNITRQVAGDVGRVSADMCFCFTRTANGG